MTLILAWGSSEKEKSRLHTILSSLDLVSEAWEIVDRVEDLKTSSPELLLVASPDNAPLRPVLEDTHLPPVLLLGDRSTKEDLLGCVDMPALRALVPLGDVKAAQDLVRSFLFPEMCREAMPEGGSEFDVCASKPKQDLLEIFQEALERQGVHERIIQSAQTVADEFLVNAIYNAPVGEDGMPLFRSRPRNQPVEWGAEKCATFRFVVGEERLWISIEDPYGSLEAKSLRSNWRRALKGEKNQIDQKEGGAGLGLWFILQALHTLHVEVVPGKKTRFVGSMVWKGSYRRFVGRPKSVRVDVWS